MIGIEFVEEINMLLKELPSLDAVAERLGIGRTTIRKRCEKLGYTYNKGIRAYEITEGIQEEYYNYNKESYTVIPEKIEVITKRIESIPRSAEDDIPEVINNIPKVLTEDDLYNLKLLLDNIDKIVELVEKKQIILDLPPDTNPTKTTITVNTDIWNEFNRKCEEIRYYDKKDLLSLALQEFCNKY